MDACNARHLLPLVSLILIAVSGCSDTAPAPVAYPKVSVAEVVSVNAPQWDEFTGRVAAVDSVDLRPRVSGYIQRVNFTEGQEVKAGDVLFHIDPSSYQAQVDQAQAELSRARSKAALATSEAERARKLAEAKVISTEMYEQRSAATTQAQSEIRAALAQLKIAQLNLGYTQVRAPVSGRAGRALLTAGNLAAANDTVLVTIVSIDPVHVYFEGDENTYLKYVASIRAGEQPSPRESRTPVRIGLANESGFPHIGHVDFVDNRLDEGSGTIRARAVVDNKQRFFTPGLFARVQMMASAPRPVLLIDDKAVLTDQDRKYVYVVDAHGAAQRRDVRLAGQQDGLRIVRSGLRPGDRIVVNGLQRILAPGMRVQPDLVAMTATNAAVAPN